MQDAEARQLVARVESLLEGLDALGDPAARERATEVVGALLDLYGEGLGRIVAEISARDDGALAGALAGDELVSHLLLLHGLHPVSLERRVRAALDEVRPYLESHGGNVDLVGLQGGVARLRLEGSCNGCPSSTMTLKLAIEDAIRKAAPDIEEIEAEGAEATAPAPGLIQLEVADSLGGSAPAQRSAGGKQGASPPAQRSDPWAMAGGLPELSNGGPLLKEVSGESLLFVELDGTPYAYRPECPSCEGSLAGGAISGVELACPECGSHYDVLRAGRCLDSPALHLQPVPLLVDGDGLVKVALGSPG